MITIFGWHSPWTSHDLGAPIASLVALLVAPGVLGFMVWLRRPAAVKHTPDELRPPRPSAVLCAVISVISVATIVAALLVIGRYWTGPTLARWAWMWGVRWMLPVLVVAILLILDIRRETKHQPDRRGTGSGTAGVPGGAGVPGDGAGVPGDGSGVPGGGSGVPGDGAGASPVLDAPPSH